MEILECEGQVQWSQDGWWRCRPGSLACHLASSLNDWLIKTANSKRKNKGKKTKRQWMKRKKVLARNVDSPEQRYRWSHVICLHIHLVQSSLQKSRHHCKQSLCTRFSHGHTSKQLTDQTRKIELQDSELMKLHSPKTNTAPAGRPSQKETHLNQPQCFSCYVSFREGNTNLGLMKKRLLISCQFQATDIIHELQISIGILLDSIGELNAVQGFPFLRTGHNDSFEAVFCDDANEINENWKYCWWKESCTSW